MSFPDNVLDHEDDFKLKIVFVSKKKKTIKVFGNPLITNPDSDGQVGLQLEKVVDSCFKGVLVHTEMLFPDRERSVKKLTEHNSVTYKFDIRNTYAGVGEGYYRLKVYYRFALENEYKEVISKWVYFFIPTNDISVPKDAIIIDLGNSRN